jgi:hypothetical protein
VLPGLGQTLGVAGGVSVLVTRAPDEHGVLRCGGDVLTPQRPPACGAPRTGSGTIRPGTWFTDQVSGLQVVCTRAGHGTLTFAGRPMVLSPWPDRQPARWARREDGVA